MRGSELVSQSFSIPTALVGPGGMAQARTSLALYVTPPELLEELPPQEANSKLAEANNKDKHSFGKAGRRIRCFILLLLSLTTNGC